MSYIIYDYKIIKIIEAHKDVKLTLPQAILFSIINSYNRKGQKCHESYNNLATQLKCSRRWIIKCIDQLEKMKLISVHRPKNKLKQKQEQIANTLWVHKDLRNLLQDTIKEASELNLVNKASELSSPYNKNNGISQSPFKGDCSSETELDPEVKEFLDSLSNLN
jgi:DNA-binding transcriptional regulator YhcF (GntR family)